MTIWVSLAFATNRLHDRDKSAWWLLMFSLGPPILLTVGSRAGSCGFILILIGSGIIIWAFVELGLLRRTAEPNKYGPDLLQL